MKDVEYLTEWLEDSIPDPAADTDTEARRRALIALHVAGRAKSAREATRADPELEDFAYLDGNPPVKWVAWADSGGCYADW